MKAIELQSMAEYGTGITNNGASVEKSVVLRNHPTNCDDDVPVSLGRMRSLSVATDQPSVETVVVKAKRAASSLWLMLHAQSCVAAGKCAHVGCQDAKKIHLHLKTCPATSAGEGVSCPTSFKGCEQSRKLLSHYRRCRSIRAHQAGQLSHRRDSTVHHCLICSLVARQARSLLDRPASSPKVKPCGLAKPADYKAAVPSFAISSSISDSCNEGMGPPPPRCRPLQQPKLAGDVPPIVLTSNVFSSTQIVPSWDGYSKNAADLVPFPSPSGVASLAEGSSECCFESIDAKIGATGTRQRSASDAGQYSLRSEQDLPLPRRSRSASVGGTATFETIDEEEVLSDDSQDSVHSLDYTSRRSSR